LHSDEELDLILSVHSRRKMSKNLTLQYGNTVAILYIRRTAGLLNFQVGRKTTGHR